MSENIRPKLVVDSTINDITDQINYLVKQSGSSVNYTEYKYNSKSTNSVTFNCQIPSENIILDREVLIKVKFRITVTHTSTGAVGENKVLFNYGVLDSFAPFPFAQMCNTISAQINNVNVSTNTKDILAPLLRLCDKDELAKYSSMCPAKPDYSYKYYSNGLLYATNTTFTSISNNHNLYGFDQQGLNEQFLSRGSYRLLANSSLTTTNATTPANNNTTANNADGVATAVLEFETTEPLFCSPFIFMKNTDNCAGMLGINNLNITINLDSNAKRVFRTALDNYYTGGNLGGAVVFTHTCVLNDIVDATLLVRQISTQPSQLVPSKNVIPYMSYDRYVTQIGTNVPTIVNTTRGKININDVGESNSTTTTVSSSTISLSSIPDYFIIFARKRLDDQDMTDSDSFYPIRSCSIQFNNVSNILANASVEQLFRISQKNGSQQNFLEFFGFSSENTDNATNNAVVDGIGLGEIQSTIGSILVVSAEDLNLPNYLAGGSVGQFNFQVSLGLKSNFKGPNPIASEIVVIACQSGVLVNLSGTSQIYTGLLNKEIVMNTVSQQAMSSSSSAVKGSSRFVGGSMGGIASKMESVMKKSQVKPLRSLDLLSE